MKNSPRLEEKTHDSLFTEDDDRSNYIIEGAHDAIASATYSQKCANAGPLLCARKSQAGWLRRYVRLYLSFQNTLTKINKGRKYKI